MAKSKNNIYSILKYAGTLLVVIGVALFLFMPAIKYEPQLGSTTISSTSYTGLQVLFGYSETSKINITVEYFTFSIGILVALVAMLAGGVLSIMRNKLFRYIAILASIVGAVLLFLTTKLAMPTEIISAEYIVLGTGAIMGAIFALLAGAVAALLAFTDK